MKDRSPAIRWWLTARQGHQTALNCPGCGHPSPHSVLLCSPFGITMVTSQRGKKKKIIWQTCLIFTLCVARCWGENKTMLITINIQPKWAPVSWSESSHGRAEYNYRSIVSESSAAERGSWGEIVCNPPERVWLPLIWLDPNVQQADKFKVGLCWRQARSITGHFSRQHIWGKGCYTWHFFSQSPPFLLLCLILIFIYLFLLLPSPLAPVPFIPPPYFFSPFLTTSLRVLHLSYLSPFSPCFSVAAIPQRFF